MSQKPLVVSPDVKAPPSKRAAQKPDFRSLGRLASLGPTEAWQVALLLPERHDDLTHPVQNAQELPPKGGSPIRLRLLSRPMASYGRGAPRLTFEVQDGVGGRYKATVFGDTKKWLDDLAGVEQACFMATAKPWNDRVYLTIDEMVEERWVGQLRPTYPARKQVISPEKARQTVIGLLPGAIAKAASFIKEHIEQIGPLDDLLSDCGAQGWTVEQVIHQAHLPISVAHATHATTVIRRLATLGALAKMHQVGTARVANPIDMSGVKTRVVQMPWPLTQDQTAAIEEIARRMAKPVPAHVIVAGDVGVGKTAVAAVLVATVAAAGKGRHRALVLSPNTPLAEQLYREISEFFPDLSIRLVTGETPLEEDLSASILVGTSALLHRDTGQAGFDLVVVDEQHRWSRAQREFHVSPNTHLIELSATPIPRTQALARYGRVTVVEMRQTAKPKAFTTALHHGTTGAQNLFRQIMPVIHAGDPLLVVYPKRAKREGNGPVNENQGIDDHHAVDMAAQRWEKLFPGKVRTLTSDDSDDRKAEVLAEVKNGTCQILLCTTVVEVGLNLPSLYHIVIVCPERHGLMTLHQLRGRTARNGGEGFCYLLCPEPLNEEQEEKLNTFCNTSDGFFLAEYDLRRRGAGDLSPESDKQSGADNTLLFGTKLDVGLLDEALPVWQKWTDTFARNGAQ